MITFGQKQHLGKKTLYLFILNRLWVSVFFLIILCVVAFFHDALVNLITAPLGSDGLPSPDLVNLVSSLIYLIIGGLFLISLIFIGAAIIISFLDYRNYTFSFEEFDLIVRRGIINREETSIPYRQMQDVDIEQSLMYQFFGVSRVVVITAGHEDSNMHDDTEMILEPIDKALAEEIRRALQARIGVQVVESEKQAESEEK